MLTSRKSLVVLMFSPLQAQYTAQHRSTGKFMLQQGERMCVLTTQNVCLNCQELEIRQMQQQVTANEQQLKMHHNLRIDASYANACPNCQARCQALVTDTLWSCFSILKCSRTTFLQENICLSVILKSCIPDFSHKHCYLAGCSFQSQQSASSAMTREESRRIKMHLRCQFAFANHNQPLHR